jgi:hypothetical protein
VIFSGDQGVASNDNIIERNLIVNSLIRSDVESWYPPGNPLGVGNVVQNNCVSARGIDTADGGFISQNNVTASASELLASEGGAYRALAGSPCAAVVPELAGTAALGGAPGSSVLGTSSASKPSPTHRVRAHLARARHRGTLRCARGKHSRAAGAQRHRRIRSQAADRRRCRTVGETFSRKRSSSSTR